MANGSMSSNQSGEGDIRKSLVEADLMDSMVALPGQLFYSTQIPACGFCPGIVYEGAVASGAKYCLSMPAGWVRCWIESIVS